MERREIEVLISGFHRIAPDFNTLTTEKVDAPCKEGRGGCHLMTPVLIINGQVMSKGYVTRKEKIREWVKSELKR